MGFLVPLLLAATALVVWRLLMRHRGAMGDYVTPETLERVLAEAAREEIQLTIPLATGRKPKPARSALRAYITAWHGRSAKE